MRREEKRRKCTHCSQRMRIIRQKLSLFIMCLNGQNTKMRVTFERRGIFEFGKKIWVFLEKCVQNHYSLDLNGYFLTYSGLFSRFAGFSWRFKYLARKIKKISSFSTRPANTNIISNPSRKIKTKNGQMPIVGVDDSSVCRLCHRRRWHRISRRSE